MDSKIFLSLLTVVFVAQIGLGIVSPLMPLYAESMGASGLWLGIMFSSYAFSRLIFMPVAGRLSDLGSRKRFIGLGLLAYTVISLFYIWASNIFELTFIRLLHGLASCAVIPVAQAYVGELTPKGKEGTYINLFSMSVFLGMGFGPLLGGVLTEYFSMNAAFYGMTTVCSFALYLFLRFVPASEPLSRTDGKNEAKPVGSIIRDSRVQAATIFRFSRAFWRRSIKCFLPLLAISTLKMTPASIGLVLSAYLVAGGGIQGLISPLFDRLNKVALVAICSTIGPALLLLIPYVPSGQTLLAILLPTALLGAFARGAMLAINVETGKQHRGMGTVMGIFTGAGSLGMMTGPIVFGYTVDVFGLNSVFIGGAVVGITGGLLTTYFLIKWLALARQPALS
ncbi:MAG: MFS transporter [Proteobacteria bacterium]|nr:MFS transporter [Pseudomonadota bacterium]